MTLILEWSIHCWTCPFANPNHHFNDYCFYLLFKEEMLRFHLCLDHCLDFINLVVKMPSLNSASIKWLAGQCSRQYVLSQYMITLPNFVNISLYPNWVLLSFDVYGNLLLPHHVMCQVLICLVALWSLEHLKRLLAQEYLHVRVNIKIDLWKEGFETPGKFIMIFKYSPKYILFPLYTILSACLF